MSETEMQEEGPRRRYKAPWSPDGPEYDPLLPYGPKVYLARKKKPDPWWIVALEVKATSVYIHMYTVITKSIKVSMGKVRKHVAETLALKNVLPFPHPWPWKHCRGNNLIHSQRKQEYFPTIYFVFQM
jgi:hypothetical protein